MTLLVALRGADGIVLAADSRGTFGDPSQTTAQNDSQEKAHILSAHAAVLTAGAGEVGAMLVQETKALIDGGALDGVTPVMTGFVRLAAPSSTSGFRPFPLSRRQP